MQLNTKFDVNDEVFFLHKNSVKSAIIVALEINVRINNFQLPEANYKYYLNDRFEGRSDLFKSKEELLASL